jgi:hypothetical protein
LTLDIGNQVIMPKRFRLRAATLLVSTLLALVIGAAAALAQSGSAGGSIGNDDKSLSGSRSAEPERPSRSLSGSRSAEPERPSRSSKPEAAEPRRSAPRRASGGGGSGNFDGAWMVVSTGITCSGTSTGAVVVTSGRIIGEGLSGTVSPSGAARSVGNYNGVTVISTGRVSGRSGSGTFKRSDGCIGRWVSSKQ